MTEQVTLPDPKALLTEGKSVVETAHGYVCEDDTQQEQCLKFFAFVKARKKEIEADPQMKELNKKRDLLHKMHKDACDLITKVLLPWEQAEKIIEAIMRPYTRRKAELAEQERQKKQAEADRKAAEERELALLEAQLDGELATVKVLEQLPAVTTEVKAERIAPAVEGAGITRPWTWEITDEKLIPDEYWLLDKSRINKEVKALKEKFALGGIRAFQDVGFRG